jgi:phospholipid-binding lipoprotein MlaA
MLKVRNLVLGMLIVMLTGPWTGARAADDPGDAGLTAPATAQAADHDWTQLDENEEELTVWDPIEPVNRGVFWFNDKLYFYLLKPVARGYRAVVPEPARESVGNFFHNLASPVRVLNSLLQLKGREAVDETLKCIFNSTFGLAGLFDLGVGLPADSDGEDFGQTLGHYGTPPGFYLVIPVLGPSNARDTVGLVGDALVNPVTSPYYVKLKTTEVIGLQAFDKVNKVSLDKDTYEAIKKDALDPYLFVRNAYMQHRAAKVEK